LLEWRCPHLRTRSNRKWIHRGRNLTLQIVRVTRCEQET
jgi:hypothetical protein